MIYIIIGGSCCGKTSFVKNTWLNGESFASKKDILPYTETKDAILLGRYSNIDGRERSGTDTISRSQISMIGEQVFRLIGSKDIVIEGDRVISRKLFDMLLGKSEIKLILIYSDIESSLYRNYKNNTTTKTSTLKAALTKAKNIYIEYKNRMNGVSIDTSTFVEDDFKRFNMSNMNEFIDTNIDELLLTQTKQ